MQAVAIQAALDARLPAPRRRTGTFKVDSIDSFIAMVNRHKSDATVVYCSDDDQPSLTAVMNDHLPDATGAAGFRDHRVSYQPELSDQWQAWTEHDGEALSMSAFAEHLEENAMDMVDPAVGIPQSTKDILNSLGVNASAPSVIRGLARSLTIHESSKVIETRNMQSGEAQLMFESTHMDADGKPLMVPGAFLVGIPIYKGGPQYLFVARLRYRKQGATIVWSYSLTQTDAAKRQTMQKMIERVRSETFCLAIEGSP
jgi:uncharacterized protein YfdQ (DUF2303 family)